MPQSFKGSTPDQAVILGAWFWTKGTKIKGKFTGKFSTHLGDCFGLLLEKPVPIPGDRLRPAEFDTVTKDVSVVAIGGLKGFQATIEKIAAENPAFTGLILGDVLSIECVGIKDVGQDSPMLIFAVEIFRK